MNRQKVDLNGNLYDLNDKDADLISRLYDAYGEELFLIARHRLMDKEKANEAVQEVFFIATIKIKKLRDHDNKKLWLVETLSNVVKRILCNKKYTKDGRLREILVDHIEEQGCYDVYDFEELGVIKDLKDVLKEREYRYIEERFINDKSNQEIADAFGLSYSGAASFGDRVLKKVKKILLKTGKNSDLN